MRDTAHDARAKRGPEGGLLDRFVRLRAARAERRVAIHDDQHIFDSTPRERRADEVDLMRELATRIWARLERTRAEEAEQASEERLAAGVAA